MAAVPAPSPSRETLREFGELAAFSVRTLRSLPGALRYGSEILRQLGILVRSTTHFTAILSVFAGVGMVNFGYYFLRSAGAADYTGLILGVGSPRAVVGMFVGYVFAAKVGAGMVAEIGSMRINQELDAYETEGVGARHYVIAPRVIAATLYTPIACGVTLYVMMIAGFVTAVHILSAVPPETFYRYAWGNQAVPDQIYALGVTFILGLTMSLVAAFYGQRAEGGPAGVGAAVARSLLVNLVLMHIIIGVTAFAVYGDDLGLPIGG